MEAIDASLPTADSVAWFNKLYLAVTRAVHGKLAEATFADPRFLARLDVVFANLYFRALDAGKDAPRAWAPLVQCRRRKGIAPIQFALAGMNAHINYDLPAALAQTCRELGVDLFRARRQRRDYESVNTILERSEAKVKRWFATDFVGVVDVALGDVDDRIAMWKVTRARDAAWANAQTLTALGSPLLRRRYLETLDRTVGFAGRGLLVPLR
jgi:Family of unknown function (DUF5995)